MFKFKTKAPPFVPRIPQRPVDAARMRADVKKALSGMMAPTAVPKEKAPCQN